MVHSAIHPVIGILTIGINDTRQIELSGVQAELAYLTRIGSKIPGTVIVFSPADIDWKRSLVRGYRFRFDSETVGQWESSYYPIPDVVYDQMYAGGRVANFAETRRRLKYYTKGRFFNSRYLNKMNVYRYLSTVEELKTYLPETRRLVKPNDLNIILENYGSAYIKPITGSLGRGIIRAVKEAGHYKYQTRSGKVGYAKSIPDLYSKIKHLAGGRAYLVQQGLELYQTNNKVVDIRVLMQKNGRGIWTLTKMYVRAGLKGQITSNLASGGTAYPLSKVLSEKYSDAEISLIRQGVRDLAFKTCQALELTSKELYGEIGVDIGLDKYNRLWLIEMNSKPRKTTRGKGDPRLVSLSFAKPLRYARFLLTQEPLK